MARRKWNKTELRVFIIRKYKSQKQFCEVNNINYRTFATWMKDTIYSPTLENTIAADIEAKSYDVQLIIEN